jgi:DNA-binding beta-propeller fold protein YncE
VTLTKSEATPGRGPYGIAISPDGKFAYTNNLGGLATRAQIDAAGAPEPRGGDSERPRAPGSVASIDLATMQVVSAEEVGPTPETVALSPNGKMLAVIVANGASVQKKAPNYSTVFGLVRLFKVDGGKLSLLTTLENGHWCQGATFSADSKTLLVQCGAERSIEVYRIDGDTVSRDQAATIFTKSRGGSIATARSR